MRSFHANPTDSPPIHPSNSNIQEPDSALLGCLSGEVINSTLAHRTELSRVAQLQSGKTAKKIFGPAFPFGFGWNADHNFPSVMDFRFFKSFSLQRSMQLNGCVVDSMM